MAEDGEDTALEQANELFHEGFGDARAAAAKEAPVLVVMADELVVFLHGARTAFPFQPRAFDVAKCAAHVPVALVAMLHGGVGSIVTATRARLASLRAQVQRALERIAEGKDPAPPPEVDELLHASAELCARALDAGHVPPDELAAFGSASGPKLLRLTAHAMALELEALHGAVERGLATLSGEERAALQVVVTGDHQARARNLGMQYFRRRLGEPEGAEERVAYGENVSSEEEALELVGERRLDRVLATVFFGDPKRLQRDVLGDAAKASLETRELPPIS